MMVTGRSGERLFFGYPLTLQFDITHHIFAAGNTANFSIYNLSTKNRNEILFDEYIKKGSYPITLNAGYGSQQEQDFVGPRLKPTLPLIFSGTVNVAYTERVGGDLITRINALDNGDVTSDKPSAYFPSDFTVPINTPFVDMIKSMMRLLGEVKVGEVVVTPPQPNYTRARPHTGSVWNMLQALKPPNGHVFIDNGVCHMLGQNDVLPGLNNLGTLSSDSGLLNIPKYMGENVECSCVFEPALAIGKTMRLSSDFDTRYSDKVYKIIQYTHSGTISGTLSGDAISTISLAALPATVAAGS